MPDLSFSDLAEVLTARYGKPEPPAWGLDPFEAVVSALFDRAMEPPRRDLAVAALRDAGLLDPQALAESDPAEAAEALRSAGVKVQERALVPLQRLAKWLVELHHGDAGALVGTDGTDPTAALREELTAVNGVGPATADALLLFALKRPVYPLDRPTYRLFARHGWIDETYGYGDARDAVERLAPGDPAALARLSAWFDRVGRDYCRASVAKCDRCPLKPWLPEGGPVDPTA